MKTQKIALSLLTLSVLVLTNCTKKVDYELTDYKTRSNNVEKSLFDTKGEYLMSASQQQASRTAPDGFSYYSADNKRVKIEITETSLRIIETEKDERFASNAENNKLVLEVPIDHVQLQCATDKYGNCTNKEEDTNKVGWKDKSLIKIKFEAAKSGQLDLLPIMSSQSFGENCYSEIGSELVKSSVEKDAINFQVRRTFITKPECITSEAVSQSEQISDGSISAVYHYSLVRLDSVLSKDYKTISYPAGSKDEQTFGFFSTNRTQLDVDNNQTDKSEIQIMNRWNPNRKEIVYYLSDEFSKPENKMLKDLTFETVDSINKGLSIAGVSFKINLKDPAGKVPGDIRNSMIVLVEDPIAAGVIGYGPQTEDPKTGEIISARTIMYGGAIKSQIKYTYDDIVREKRNAALEAQKIQKGKMSDKSNEVTLAPNLMTKYSRRERSMLENSVVNTEAKKKTGKTINLSNMNSKISATISKEKTTTQNSSSIKSKDEKSQIENTLKNYTANRSEEYSSNTLKSKIQYLQNVKNCAYSANKDLMVGSISKKLADKFATDAKFWQDLSTSEKESVIAIIMPEIWIPTLIHEMGHNLGLRHNFKASEDKENFYSEKELAAEGIEKSVVASSVMDYIDDVRALPILGKYDIAALKFGYLRQVDTALNGVTKTLNIPTTLENLNLDLKDNTIELKTYGYCTDENVGANAGCKRFDLGTSYTEIVQNVIRSYEEAYTKRNLRAGRANMSLFDDSRYASRIKGLFNDLRLMMEVSEGIKYRYNLPYTAPEWESMPFLKDLKTATLIGGQFMTKVLLVPDTTCAVSLATNPNQIIAVVNLSNINPDAISCATAGLDEKYVVVGQAGKSFNSKKDPESKNAFADQIDVRGIWLDKLMAIRTLTARQINSFTMDKNIDSYLNVDELRGGILDAVGGLLTDNVVAKVPFTLADGSVTEFEISYDLSKSQIISKLIHPMIARRLGVNETSTTQIQQVVASALNLNAKDTTGAYRADNAVARSVAIYRNDKTPSLVVESGDQAVIIDDVKYVAKKSNQFAFEAMINLSLASALEKLTLEQIKTIAEAKAGGQIVAPTTATTEEQAVWDISTETLDAFLNQVIKPSDFYKQLLTILPAA